MEEADKFMPPNEVRNDSLRPEYKPQPKLAKMQRVAEPQWEQQSVLHTSNRAPPNPAAVASVSSGMVNFDPKESLVAVKSAKHKKHIALCKRLATKGFAKEWNRVQAHPYPDFWKGQIPDSIYECQEAYLYDNRKVDPDWSERDKSWWIVSDCYFDINGVKMTPNMVCKLFKQPTGEAPPADQDPALAETICDCPHKIRASIKTKKALIDHYLEFHGSYLCYRCHMTFPSALYLHGHLH